MITLNSNYWGRLAVDESEGFAEYVTVTLNNEKRTVWLNIFEDVLPNTPIEKIVPLWIASLHVLKLSATYLRKRKEQMRLLMSLLSFI